MAMTQLGYHDFVSRRIIYKAQLEKSAQFNDLAPACVSFWFSHPP